MIKITILSILTVLTSLAVTQPPVQNPIQISKERSYYRLLDKIRLDIIPDRAPVTQRQKVEGLEKKIEHFVMKYEDSLPARLVDNLIRYGCGGAKTAAAFEMSVSQLFSLMGYESDCLGQGHGRVADVTVKYRDKLPPNSYGLIVDTKAYEKYTFPAGDVRKMKEYISSHGVQFMQDMIPKYAFVFVSTAFGAPEEKLEEIARDTGVGGTAIDVFSLMELGAKVVKRELSIAGIYPMFAANKQFVCEGI